MAALEIFKASAGSGKTFSIVQHYLLLVLKKPNLYRNILAVTFTNKATAEMKDRIISELSVLSEGGKSAYLSVLQSNLKMAEAEIRQSARIVLRNILHDYSRFSVSTIDSFFQRVVRSFSREMQMNQSYRTVIDTNSVLNEAIDRLFLDIGENELLREWMLQYAVSQMAAGRNWNFRKEMTARAQLVFSETFKTFGESLLNKLSDKRYLRDYYNKLQLIIENYESALQKIGRDALEELNRNDLTSGAFKYGERGAFVSIFKKLADGKFEEPGVRAIAAQNNIEEWYTAKSNPADIAKIRACYPVLNSLLVQAIQKIESEHSLYNSAKAIVDQIFSFGLTTDIAMKIREVAIERNMMLLNDTGHLLQNVIGESDAPFVYEKLGNSYRHFMLDEFQDTSRLQYRNFRPLVTNALAEGHQSMVVGDVKQSIYRWRNGDWDLLANQLESDFHHFGINVTALETNWRSTKNVIDFNNTFFKTASELINHSFNSQLDEVSNVDCPGFRDMILKAYEDHFQKVSPLMSSSRGEVIVQFSGGESKLRKADFHSQALEQMIVRIEQLQAGGVQPSDIAILTRTGRESAEVVTALLNYKTAHPESKYRYDIISGDSMLLSKSPVVQFILGVLKVLASRGNDVILAELLYFYNEMNNSQGIDHVVRWKRENRLPELFERWLGDKAESEYLQNIMSLPLYEMVVRMVTDFNLKEIKGQQVYIQGFLDVILDYERDESGGISGFLEWWELVSDKRSLSMAKLNNVMEVMTIHKSKGLEFDAVIIPFCDWSLLPKTDVQLCVNPKVEPFNDLDLVQVGYSNRLMNSIFAEEYLKEQLYSLVDNLNLLYVAFTRAVKSLTIYAPFAEKLPRNISSSAVLLQQIFTNPPMLDSDDLTRYIDYRNGWDQIDLRYQYGELVTQKVEPKTESEPESERVVNDLNFYDNSDRLKLKLHNDDALAAPENEPTSQLVKGRLIHEIFEKIESTRDIQPALRRMVAEGKILSSELTVLEAQIAEKLSVEPFAGWFGGNWKVLNERDILRGGAGKHRPDRVMMGNGEVIILDYKTGEKRDSDIRQMRGYLTDLIRMGYSNCSGYIWYLESNDYIPVSVKS